MTRAQYAKWSRPFRKNKRLRQALVYTDLILTGLVYLSYPVLLCVLLVSKDIRLWRCFFVPFISFLAVSGLRKLINAERPYEKWHFQPIIRKEKHGESFPSRHVFSVFVIAFAFYYTFVPVGVVLTVFGVILAAVRVTGGVHFPRDVLAGAAIGILAGVLGFFVL
ncbi:MAG: phosphatase PAP2 family protein [Candidatus Fimenecus sp.]